MNFSHRAWIWPILLIVFAAAAVQAQATQGASLAPSAAPSTGAARPEAPMATLKTASVGMSRPSATRPRVVVPSSNSLLADVPNASLLTEPVLVVPGKQMNPQAIDQTIEDLSVMSRIIEKHAFGEYSAGGGLSDYRAVAGIAWRSYLEHNGTGPGLFFPLPGRAKPLYLGGYGVVFFIQVSYPLLPPPETPQEQPTGQQEDCVWAEAKRSVFDPGAPSAASREEAEAVEPYNREKVDAVRNALIVLMKHTANIRVLEPGEWITVVVQGPAATGVQEDQNPSAVATTRPPVAKATGRTMLILRATKADVDQYAKGQLNQQQFEQRLQAVTY